MALTPEQYQAAIARNEQARAEEQARRDAEQAEIQRLLDARKNGRTFDSKEQPTIFSLNLQQREKEAAEHEALEKQRIATLDPRQVWLSTLPWSEQKRIEKWEAANKGLLFPMPANFQVQLKEA